MDSIHIYGENPLLGQIRVQGSKNAALPILAATILVPGISVIHNCPRIADVFQMIKLLKSVGCLVEFAGNTVIVNAAFVKESTMPAEHMAKMRSSIIFMGAMLGRLGRVTLGYPGGCVIGERPIDFHLKAMEKLGVRTAEQEERFTAEAARLHGATVVLPFPSVGATENTILAAVRAEGATVLKNAALEPEIGALCSFLRNAGARIMGDTAGTIRIAGSDQLHSCEYTIPADRIVAGTYLLACLSAGGEILLEKAPVSELETLFQLLERAGAVLRTDGENLLLHCPIGYKRGIGFVKTEVYPGFPTDLQSQLLAALAVSDGESIVEETIFESRFKVVRELNRMGADIRIRGNQAVLSGRKLLQGDAVVAEELRGGAALVIAGLCAAGITVVSNSHYIDRGYEDICKDLRALGARVSYEEER